MGDSLQVSSGNAVNGVTHDGDQECMNNGDIDDCMSAMESDDLLVLKKVNESDRRSDTNSAENDEPASPSITACPLVNNDNEHKDDLNFKAENCDDKDAESNCSHDVESDPSHSVNDEQQPDIVSGGACEDPGTDEHSLHQAGFEVENCDDKDAESNCSRDVESDPSHSVSDEQQPDVVSGGACEDPGTDEHSLDQAGDSECIVTRSSYCAEVVNSVAAVGGNPESQCTVQDEDSSSRKPASHAASDTGTAGSDWENMEDEDLPTAKCDESHHTNDAVDPHLQLDCEDDGITSVSVNSHDGELSGNAAVEDSKNSSSSSGDPQSEKHDDELTGSAAVEDSKNSPSPLRSQVSAADMAVSAATALSAVAKVVSSKPLVSSLGGSGLPAKVAVLSVTAGGGATRLAQRNVKPQAASVPSATISSSSSTRLMSKVLQDVGLLLVSQKVFKNLASIQRQKIGNSQKKCDTDLLQKLKTSHQNLVAKNHGLLTDEQKCWCGFRSESENVIEAHCLRCDFQGRCCYCKGEFVYRTQKQMKQHLWKAHRKVGHLVDRSGSLQCPFCPVDFSSRLGLMRHMEMCRRKFILTSNLAPSQHDKDIPVTAPSKQPVKIPVVASSAQISPVAVAPNLSRSTSVSSATLMSPAVMPPAVSMQLASAARNPGSVAQLLQIGKQLFTLLPSASAASPAIAVSQPPAVKSVSKMALNSAVQTAQNVNPILPIMVNNRNTKQLPVANQATMMPAAPVIPCNLQYSVCPVCNSFVKDKTALLIHMHVAHGSTHKMCQYCCSPNVTFPSLAELHSHITKLHTADCWICKTRFQPPDQLINHIADRHKVTMSKMLELRRCYLCSAVPSLPNYTAFEEHMMKLHSLQFSDTAKLWDYIVNSPNADKNWYAKRNSDGTLECPFCFGQFISTSFLYRHLYLEHDGKVVRFVHCCECGKRMPSNVLRNHLAIHTRKCSVRLFRPDVPDYGCVFVPPVGTKRLKNSQGKRTSSTTSSRPLKRVRAAETVVISDDDSDSDSEETEETYDDDSNDEDFVIKSRIRIQPKERLRRSVHTRVDRRNSSVDDVHEVLESIVDSGGSETAAKRSVGFRNTPICPAPVRPSAAATQLCNGITEDEVEIIESIVPAILDRRRRPVSKPERVTSSDRNHTGNVLTAGVKSANCKAVDDRAAGDNSNAESAENQNRDSEQLSTKSKSTLSESPAQQLMARDQIMVKSVEEVLEIDGETVLIVHGDDENDDEDDDD